MVLVRITSSFGL